MQSANKSGVRGAALADLFKHAALLAGAGDVAAARKLHATIGALLAEGEAEAGDVIDLNAERARRGST